MHLLTSYHGRSGRDLPGAINQKKDSFSRNTSCKSVFKLSNLRPQLQSSTCKDKDKILTRD